MDEGGGLENCSPGNGTVGSNPTPSAKTKGVLLIHKLHRIKRDVSSILERWLSGLKRWVANPLYC